VLALADETDIGTFVCGLSMGGVTGMWLGLHAGKRLHKLVRAARARRWQSRYMGRANRCCAEGRNEIDCGGDMERWFTASFREREPQNSGAHQAYGGKHRRRGFIACCEALREADFRESISAIRTPTLVISGTHDTGTPPADGKFLPSKLPAPAMWSSTPRTLLNIEQRDRFTHGCLTFCESASQRGVLTEDLLAQVRCVYLRLLRF